MIDMNETVPYTRNINTVIALVKPSTIASVFNSIDGTHINAITIKEVIDININPPNASHLPLLIFLNHLYPIIISSLIADCIALEAANTNEFKPPNTETKIRIDIITFITDFNVSLFPNKVLTKV